MGGRSPNGHQEATHGGNAEAKWTSASAVDPEASPAASPTALSRVLFALVLVVGCALVLARFVLPLVAER
jgi:hypothetical protein